MLVELEDYSQCHGRSMALWPYVCYWGIIFTSKISTTKKNIATSRHVLILFRPVFTRQPSRSDDVGISQWDLSTGYEEKTRTVNDRGIRGLSTMVKKKYLTGRVRNTCFISHLAKFSPRMTDGQQA